MEPEEHLVTHRRSGGQREVVRLRLTLVPPGHGLNLGRAVGQGLEGGAGCVSLGRGTSLHLWPLSFAPLPVRITCSLEDDASRAVCIICSFLFRPGIRNKLVVQCQLRKETNLMVLPPNTRVSAIWLHPRISQSLWFFLIRLRMHTTNLLTRETQGPSKLHAHDASALLPRHLHKETSLNAAKKWGS